MSDGEAGNSSVLSTDHQLKWPHSSGYDSNLPDDLPGESDVVEQCDKEGHADEDVCGVGVGLDKRWSKSQYVISPAKRRTNRLKRY